MVKRNAAPSASAADLAPPKRHSMGEFALIRQDAALTIRAATLLLEEVFINDPCPLTHYTSLFFQVRQDQKGLFMTELDDIAILSHRIDLGYLSRDLSFMSRVLHAHVRWANADLAPERETLSGSAALLGVIALNPGISQNDLATAVVLKKSAVTKFISEMEAEGLVIREKPKADRRYYALRLSPAGEKRWSKLQQRMRNQQEPLLAPLSGRERDKLFQLLGRLIINFADQLDGSETRPD